MSDKGGLSAHPRSGNPHPLRCLRNELLPCLETELSWPSCFSAKEHGNAITGFCNIGRCPGLLGEQSRDFGRYLERIRGPARDNMDLEQRASRLKRFDAA